MSSPSPSQSQSRSSTSSSAHLSQISTDLKDLARERRDIVSGLALQSGPDLERARERLRKRLQVATDLRDYQTANLQLHFDLEKQQALDEYAVGKALLRDSILNTHVERKRRLDVLKIGGTKKKRRSRISAGPSAKAAAATAAAAAALAPASTPPRPRPVTSLEAQNLVRVALNPDDVNRDLSEIIARLDAARGTPRDSSAGGASARKSDAIHSSRGILHFHSEVFEKGDAISAFAPGKTTPKFSGVIQSVNGKEIMVRANKVGSDGKMESHRIYVSHLRKATVNIAHTAKLPAA